MSNKSNTTTEMPKELTWWEKYQEPIFFTVLFLLSTLRFVVFGFKYFPQLQDYRNYYGYNAFTNGFPSALLATRPLQGIFNYFVWSKFWGSLIIPVIIISALLTGSAWLLYKVCKRRFGSGTLFAVIIVLSSATIEGTYWLSASTRVVAGLFFASLAIYFYDKFTYSDKKLNIILAGIASLICVCFHEQAFILAAAFTLILAVVDKKNLIWPASFLVATEIIYLILTKGGKWLPRVYPTTGRYFTYYLPIAFRQLRNALIVGPFKIMTTGFGRGIKIALESGAYWYLIALIPLIIAAVFLSKGERKKSNLGILLGILLAAAPLVSFLFLRDTWISLWTTVVCLPGIALAFDSFLSRFKKGYPVVLAAVLLIFMISSVSEIYDYKVNFEDDQQVVNNIAGMLGMLRLDLTKSVAILGLEPSRLAEQNYPYHEHIQSITSNEILFNDAYRAIKKTNIRQTLMPIPTGKSLPSDAVMNADLYIDYADGDISILYPIKQEGETFFQGPNGIIGRIYINSEGFPVFVRD